MSENSIVLSWAVLKVVRAVRSIEAAADAAKYLGVWVGKAKTKVHSIVLAISPTDRVFVLTGNSCKPLISRSQS